MTPYERARGKPYAETFRCPGGELCLDFCNTGQEARDPPAEEWLTSYADVVDWLDAAGALSRKHAAALRSAAGREPEAARKVWSRAIRLREALATVLLAKAAGRAPADGDLRVIEAEYARTAPCARLAPTEEGFRWTVEADNEFDSALRPVLESAISLMTSERMRRVRRCGNSTCYWLFVDETKNRSRRWCEMASCGNLMKVRRHRERHRAAD
jgi:predicted RNA-binding Zn ribbon-like protein